MSDRMHSLTVVLEGAVHEDEANALCAAIRMMRGVIAAEPNVAGPDFFAAREQAARELRARVYEVLAPQNP